MPRATNMASFQQLAAEARDGDADAAYMLATKAPDKGFLSWLARWVPPDEMTVAVFNVFADAYRRMEMDKLDAQCKSIETGEMT